MKRKIMILLLVGIGSLSVVETSAMLGRFKRFFQKRSLRRTPKSIKRPQTKRFFSQSTKTIKPSFSKQKVGVGAGILGGGGFVAWLTGWWSGEDKEIAKELGVTNIIPKRFQSGMSDKNNNENPDNQLLRDYLGYTTVSSVVQMITNNINEQLSLETKKKLALYLANTLYKTNTEDTLVGSTTTESLKLLPLFVMVLKNISNKVVFDEKIPVTLLPKSEFSPFLYNGHDKNPIMDALKENKNEMNREEFKKSVSQPIIKMMHIKNTTGFEEELWKLITDKYKNLKNQNELLVVKDQYQYTKSPTYDHATRGNLDKQASVFTFGTKELNRDWAHVYFENKYYKDTKIFEEFIGKRYPHNTDASNRSRKSRKFFGNFF